MLDSKINAGIVDFIPVIGTILKNTELTKSNLCGRLNF